MAGDWSFDLEDEVPEGAVIDAAICAVSYIGPDGRSMVMCWQRSEQNLTTRLGLLEWAKAQLIQAEAGAE